MEFEAVEDTVKNFTRMTLADFYYLLVLISPKVKKIDTHLRQAITVKERFALTLSFLATGDSFTSLQYLFRVSKQSISTIVPEVCNAIIESLAEYVKIILLILLSTCLSLANSEYPRFKRRGPLQNGPPRPPPPPPPQFGKKWGKPPQKMPPQKMPPHFMQNRPFPGPPQQVRGGRPKPPIIKSHAANIPLNNIGHVQHSTGPKFQQYPYQHKSPPMKVYFKNPVQQHNIPNLAVSGGLIQFPQESNQIPNIVHKPEKPSFVSSPSIPSALEYDYHIQTNGIPTNTNPIKQIGEKGPIHTIPAPNLTPADKPSNLQFRKQQHYHQQDDFRLQHPQYDQQSIHQYQVTEPIEQAPKQIFREQINPQTHYIQNPGTQSYQNIPPANQHFDQFLNQQLEQQNAASTYQNLQSVFYNQNNPGLMVQDNGQHGINIGFGQPEDGLGGQEDMVFSNSKHYQVMNDQFSTGESNQNIHTQAIQSNFAQQHPQVLTKFLEDPGYIQQYQQENLQLADEKSLNARPEYHSFNYDEQAHQAQAKSGQNYVTAAYSLGSSEEIIKGENIQSRSSSVDPLTQAQIVQNYFNTRSQNIVEPDAKPSATEIIEKENLKTPYYTSLPSKEAAERLAKLQAAGKVNSSLMKLANNRNQQESDNEMSSIYVPDDNNSPDEKEDRIDRDSKEQSLEYEDYQEEEASQSEEESGFGHKLKTGK